MVIMKKYRLVIIAGIVFGVLLLAGMIDWLIKDSRPEVAAATVPAPLPKETVSRTEALPSYHLETMTIRSGSVIGDYLAKFRFSPQQIHDLIQTVKPVYNLADIRAGRTLEFELAADNSLHMFRYRIDDDQYLEVRRTADTWQAVTHKYDYRFEVAFVSGRIEDNLFNAIDRLGEDPSLAIGLSEIFAWDVDFYADLRRGDSFKILFEKKFLDGQPKGYGPILAAEFVNQGQVFQAIRYDFPDGHGDYYTPSAESVRKELLKSPLKMGRITSRFTYHRRHPIYKVYRPHLGIDIAAPVGTAVHVAGDGRVTYRGRKGAAGRMIEVRHANRYTTQYLHLSRYARGLQVGSRVHQGQVIAYVGSSGASTGPHLDYRIKYNGKYVNPLKQRFERAEPLAAKYVSDFGRQCMACLRILDADASLRTYFLARLNDRGKPESSSGTPARKTPVRP